MYGALLRHAHDAVGYPPETEIWLRRANLKNCTRRIDCAWAHTSYDAICVIVSNILTDTHLLQLPSLRMDGVMRLLPLCAFAALTGKLCPYL